MKILIDLNPERENMGDALADIADQLSRDKTDGKNFFVLDSTLERLAAIYEEMSNCTSSDEFETANEKYDLFVEQFLDLITKEVA